MKQFITEIHRRSLWQVLLIYIGGAWIVFEIVQTVTEGLGLPQWFPAFAALLLLIGLPVVIATAFVREGEPGAAISDPTLIPVDEARTEAARRRRLLTWRNAGLSFLFALAVWGVVATGWLVLGGEGGTPAVSKERPSVAVLPLVNRSGLEEDEYFTDGIHDEILTQLYKISGLSVRARTSVMGYRDSPKNIRQIGEELSARYLLEGGVQRAGETVRINVQLVDAETDEHVFAETYDRELSVENLLAVQRELALRIADALEATLTPQEREQIEQTPTDNLEAYDYYLRGNAYLSRRLLEDTRAAAEMYEKAVELDPNFAEAYAALSWARLYLYWQWGHWEQVPGSRQAVERALQLDPDLPSALLSLGYYYYYADRDYEGALEQFTIVQAQLPDNAEAMAAIGWIRRRQGRWEESVARVERALELDPLHRSWTNNLAGTYIFMRRYAEADRYIDRAISLDPDNPDYYARKSMIYLRWQGNTDRAKKVLREASRRIDAAQVLVRARTLVRIFGDEYAEALGRITLDASGVQSWHYYLAKAEFAGLREDSNMARAYYDSALAVLEAGKEQLPVVYSGLLGLAYAGLGRKEEAVRATRTAVYLLPVSEDAREGPNQLAWLAEVYLKFREYDAAINQLELVLSVPSPVSAPLLRIDPLWDPLRDHPRFQELLDQYTKD